MATTRPVVEVQEVVKVGVDDDTYFYIPSGRPGMVIVVSEDPYEVDIKLMRLTEVDNPVADEIRLLLTTLKCGGE